MGKYSFVKNIYNFKDIELFDAGGVVKTDEQGYVFNYGIVLNVFTNKEIEITDINFGLNNDVVIDQTGIKTFSENEYKTKIFNLIDNAELNKIIDSAYNKRFFNQRELECKINLKKGKTYIYIPLKYSKDNNISLSEAVITVKYKVEGKEAKTSNSAVFFAEVSRDISQIEKMFKIKE